MATIHIDQNASGTTVRLAVGDEAQLVLPEARGGGYKWRVVSPNSTLFDVRDDGFARPSGIGGTGAHKWTITARHAGKASLELAYGRSWETEAAKRFCVNIEVS